MNMLTRPGFDRDRNLPQDEAAPVGPGRVSSETGIQRGSSVLTLTCENCGEAFERRHRQRFCGLSCRSRFYGRTFRGENHPTYRGRVPTLNGYIRIYIPEHPLAKADGYVLEHRAALFDAGIDIPKGYHVHHVNHDKTDNRVENLMVLTPDDHKRIHPSHDGAIINQFGTFTVGTDEERKAKQKARMAEWRAKNKAHIKAYKEARRADGKSY